MLLKNEQIICITHRKEVPVKERTLKEEFEFWMELYGEELSYKAENDLKELIEQI